MGTRADEEDDDHTFYLDQASWKELISNAGATAASAINSRSHIVVIGDLDKEWSSARVACVLPVCYVARALPFASRAL